MGRVTDPRPDRSSAYLGLSSDLLVPNVRPSIAVLVSADAEEVLDGLAVQVAGLHAAEHVGNFWKSVKPCEFGRHPESPLLDDGRERSGII